MLEGLSCTPIFGLLLIRIKNVFMYLQGYDLLMSITCRIRWWGTLNAHLIHTELYILWDFELMSEAGRESPHSRLRTAWLVSHHYKLLNCTKGSCD